MHPVHPINRYEPVIRKVWLDPHLLFQLGIERSDLQQDCRMAALHALDVYRKTRAGKDTTDEAKYVYLAIQRCVWEKVRRVKSNPALVQLDPEYVGVSQVPSVEDAVVARDAVFQVEREIGERFEVVRQLASGMSPSEIFSDLRPGAAQARCRRVRESAKAVLSDVGFSRFAH